MSTEVKSSEKAAERTKRLIRERAEAERIQREAEHAEHLASLSSEAKERAAVLDKVMKNLDEGEQRQVRLHAAIICQTKEGYGPNQKQAAHDDVALALARYMATGIV